MEFSRPGSWSWLPLPSPGDLPNPRIEHMSPTLQADSLPAEPQGKPNVKWTYIVKKYKRGKKIYKINPKQLRKWQ